MSDIDSLARAWILFTLCDADTKEYENAFWIFDRIIEMTEENPEEVFELILDILKKDNSIRIIQNLAAGPLENLLVYHGEKFIERIEKLAKRDPDFKMLLGGVWQNNISNNIWQRLQAAAGKRW